MDDNEHKLPDFTAMSDKELWEWDAGPCFGDLDEWSEKDIKAVLAQGKELTKRAKASGLPYKEFIRQWRQKW